MRIEGDATGENGRSQRKLNILDGIGRYLNTVASMYRKQHGFNLDTYGGDDITSSSGK